MTLQDLNRGTTQRHFRLRRWTGNSYTPYKRSGPWFSMPSLTIRLSWSACGPQTPRWQTWLSTCPKTLMFYFCHWMRLLLRMRFGWGRWSIALRRALTGKLKAHIKLIIMHDGNLICMKVITDHGLTGHKSFHGVCPQYTFFKVPLKDARFRINCFFDFAHRGKDVLSRLHFSPVPVFALGNWIPKVLYSWGCTGHNCGLAQAVFTSTGSFYSGALLFFIAFGRRQQGRNKLFCIIL